VLAHEIAHHVRNVLGTSEQVRGLQQHDPSLSNELSVRLELQADCFAGVSAASVFASDNSSPELEAADISEGIEAAGGSRERERERERETRPHPGGRHRTHRRGVTGPGLIRAARAAVRRGVSSGDSARYDTFPGGV
jgi:predicted metalloprotease